MPVENWSAERIRRTYGVLDSMRPASLGIQIYGKVYAVLKSPGSGLGSARLTSGVYTDDTQMMIGVAESLVENRGFDPEHMARRFVENVDPGRGYGPGTLNVLGRIRRGDPWDRPAKEMFGGTGSFGNGAAMRAAPIGLLYHNDRGKLRDVAERSSEITHAHPAGREGGVLIAAAVALMLSHDPESLDAVSTCRELAGCVNPGAGELRRRMEAATELLHSTPSQSDVISILGNDVSAVCSVPAAIYSVLAHPKSFRGAVVYAVNLGGDTDTLGAMAGGVAGALHGVNAIPSEWLEALENGPKGRDYVLGLADRLCGLAVES
jgi:poly(ADP-ribose) glycohydrolase ARH3